MLWMCIRIASAILIHDTGYPHDGRADKDSYPHDGRADKNPYPHDRHMQSLNMLVYLH